MTQYRQKILTRYDQAASRLVYHSDALPPRLSALVKQFPRVALAALLVARYIGIAVLTYPRFLFVVIVIPLVLLYFVSWGWLVRWLAKRGLVPGHWWCSRL